MIEHVVKIKQTKAFARQDGAIFGRCLDSQFCIHHVAVTPGYALLSLLANIWLISTPFVVAKRLKAFQRLCKRRSHLFPSAVYSIASRHSSMQPYC